MIDIKNTSSLPMNSLSEIATPNANAEHITALVKESGHVTGYQLSNGNILDKPEAVALAKQGGIVGVGIAHRNGNEYLKSLPDETESNNLSNLPTVTNES
ncbi:MAG: DUF3892 domain-containing protein [Defluviitaleaceae bacterium]|nr:DUF3892 domain-containing protein [Defluviitaleaceae bacterium]